MLFLLVSIGGLGWISLLLGGHFYNEWENTEQLKNPVTVKGIARIPQQLTVQERNGDTFKVIKKINDDDRIWGIAINLDNEKDTALPKNAGAPDYKFVISWANQVEEWDSLSGQTAQRLVGEYTQNKKRAILGLDG